MWATVSFWEREEEHCVTRLKGLRGRMFHSYPFPGNKLRCHRLCWDTISWVKFIMYLSIVWVKHILLQYKSPEITKKSVNLLLSLWRPDGKRKENLQLRLWNLNIWIEKVDAKCRLAEMTLVMTSLPLFFNVCLHSHSFPFVLRSSVDGEKGNRRWNSNSRDLVASSPSFSSPPPERPGELACRLIKGF